MMTLSERMRKEIMRGIAEDYMVVREWADEVALLESQNAELLDVVRDCVNFLADLDNKTERSKALHKRAYTAHSKAKVK